MDDLRTYISLIESFIRGTIPAPVFEHRFLYRFKREPRRLSEQSFRALNRLFLDTDAFCADSSLRDEHDIDEQELLLSARRTLEELPPPKMAPSGELVLAVSEHFSIISHYEEVYLDSDEGRLALGDHLGDPSCALISADEAWFIVGGDGLTFRKHGGELDNALRGLTPRHFVHSIKLLENGEIRFLVDPWSETASTWQFDPTSGTVEKLSDGPSLVGEPWRDIVIF